MPYQKQQFMEQLKWIAINYRSWKTLDFNHIRDVLLDYFRIEDSYASNTSPIGKPLAVEYVFASTKIPYGVKDFITTELGATNLKDALRDNNDHNILMEIDEASTFGDDEKVRILKDIQALTIELDITEDK